LLKFLIISINILFVTVTPLLKPLFPRWNARTGYLFIQASQASSRSLFSAESVERDRSGGKREQRSREESASEVEVKYRTATCSTAPLAHCAAGFFYREPKDYHCKPKLVGFAFISRLFVKLN